jgi:hypothetical protein
MKMFGCAHRGVREYGTSSISKSKSINWNEIRYKLLNQDPH